MGRKLLIWLIIAVVAFFWISTVMKTCKTNDGLTASDLTESVQGTAEGIADEARDLVGMDEEETADEEERGGDAYDIDEENDAVGDEEDAYDAEEDEGRGNIIDDEEDEELEEEDEDYAEDEEYDEDAEEETLAERRSAPSSYSSGSTSDGRYLVVTGSYRMEENANAMVTKLKKMGYDDAEVFSFDFAEFYSVTAGRYSSDREAKAVADKLEAKGVSAYSHKMRSKYFD